MLTRFYGSGMITILPKRALSPLPCVIFLGDSAKSQLHSLGNVISISSVSENDVNVVGSDGIIKDRDVKSKTGLIQPEN